MHNHKNRRRGRALINALVALVCTALALTAIVATYAPHEAETVIRYDSSKNNVSIPPTQQIPETLLLLLRTEAITQPVFICPSNLPSEAISSAATGHINWMEIQQNVSYCYANTYPDANAHILKQGPDPFFAVATDINPTSATAP
jgi:hypothetical protein